MISVYRGITLALTCTNNYNYYHTSSPVKGNNTYSFSNAHTESHKLHYNCHALPLRLSSLTLPLRDAHMINDALIWVRLILASRHPEAESAGNLHRFFFFFFLRLLVNLISQERLKRILLHLAVESTQNTNRLS